MNVQNVTPSFTGKYVIPCKGKNANIYLMPNKLVDFVKENNLSAAFKTDIIESGDTTPEKFLINGSVDVEKVRTVLKKVAVINVKKSWGREMTNSHDLWEYAMDGGRINVFKEQLEIINPDVVLCCSGDVYEIMREYICKDGGEIFGYSDSTKEDGKYYDCFTAGKRKFIKFCHPAYYGKNEKYLAELARDVFKWALERK